jgi:hypothetical protein
VAIHGNVGKMHTGQPGFKKRERRPELRVDYVHIGLLLGYVNDLVIKSLMEMDQVDQGGKQKTLSACNKAFSLTSNVWLHNDN